VRSETCSTGVPCCVPFSEEACIVAVQRGGHEFGFLDLAIPTHPIQIQFRSEQLPVKGCWVSKSGRMAGSAFYNPTGTQSEKQEAPSSSSTWFRPIGHDCQFHTSPSINPNTELREAMRTAFRKVKNGDRKKRLNMPALIRKAFHDAGHFDRVNNKHEMRMGCIKHFFDGTCPQHNGLQDAELFRQEVCKELRNLNPPLTCPSFSDMVQLLGALAVDEMTPASLNRPSLFDQVPMGRVDTTDEVCLRIRPSDDDHMCKLLPNFHGPTKSNRGGGIPTRDALMETFATEIKGKMIDRNSFTEREAVALIGAHTVGHHHGFGAWVEDPMIFNNAYFRNLEGVGKVVGNGMDFRWPNNPDKLTSPRYAKKLFPDWFQDMQQVRNSSPEENEREFFKGNIGFNNIMMLNSDMALITDAWDLVQEFSQSENAWRDAFDRAYVKMGTLGVDQSTLIFPAGTEVEIEVAKVSDEDLDQEAEFFQNLEIAQEETVAKMRELHGTLKQLSSADSAVSSTSAFDYSVRIFAIVGAISLVYGLINIFLQKRAGYVRIFEPEV